MLSAVSQSQLDEMTIAYISNNFAALSPHPALPRQVGGGFRFGFA